MICNSDRCKLVHLPDTVFCAFFGTYLSLLVRLNLIFDTIDEQIAIRLYYFRRTADQRKTMKKVIDKLKQVNWIIAMMAVLLTVILFFLIIFSL